MSSSKFVRKVKSLVKVTGYAGLISGGILYYRNDEKFFRNILMPLSRVAMSPERSHKFGIFLCKWNLIPKNDYVDLPILSTTLCGIKLNNIIGLAAGYDRDGEAIKSLHKLGFGFIELGTVMPDEQYEENVKNSTLQLVEDEAILSSYNNNNNSSKGHSFLVPMMRLLRRRQDYKEIIGFNIGKNKNSNYVNDISLNVKVFSPVANYLVINIDSVSLFENSSDDLKDKENLRSVLIEVNRARQLFDDEKQRPIFLKLSPDLTNNELKDIVDVTKEKNCNVHGFIISSSTLDDNFNLQSKYHDIQNGRLSGKPVREKSTRMIEEVYKLTNGKVPIIGVGGIMSGSDAYEKILAGASALQIYTGFILYGPPVINKIKRELSELLINDGYKNVSEAVGKNVKIQQKRFNWIPFFR
ncbi:dihydroorotate dehydrogenase (quinone), mitochondrial-like [Chironomus tepperi]|uniref:dihydroorotate dehydrogenase (quinone), mitochondrial-like n=1 Tax=Chironomus tepperi TaxID=113505 RepID=UPI00391FC683